MNSTELFYGEAISFIPITEYKFANKEQLNATLDHGFNDIPFFPSWKEFLERSQNKIPAYLNYMAYLLCDSKTQQILGVIAVQLINYSELKTKVQNILPDVQKYLYLSWIALDGRYRSFNYFSLLFEYYQILIRKFRGQLNERIEGAAIVIRRMRPILWSLFNDESRCPVIINENFSKSCRKFTFLFQPGEILGQKMEPAQDHVMIFLNTSKKK
jgi:hypothetical protein